MAVDLLVGAISGLTRTELGSFDPCPSWSHVGHNEEFFVGAKSGNGNILASINVKTKKRATVCWSNFTDVDGGSATIATFSEADRDVANCLTNLHFTQHDTCISVKGSECDANGYSDNGGIIINARLAIAGSGTSNSAVLSADQSAAAQGALGYLVNEDIAVVSDNPEIHFFDLAAKNPNIAIFPAYQLNLKSGLGC